MIGGAPVPPNLIDGLCTLLAIESPEVVFLVNEQWKAPVHPHVYTNGHICASILGNEWSPVLNVESVCMTLQSMLASCKVRNPVTLLFEVEHSCLPRKRNCKADSASPKLARA